MPGSFAEFPLASDKFHLHCAHMGKFLQDRENGQNVAFLSDPSPIIVYPCH